mmetsp:Transcript_36667/g.101246  ORF Transcript_36667/g.101246 Transcript_36667/m.101246 type:complete len:322 (-) Transcript_36667:882-1847(-)
MTGELYYGVVVPFLPPEAEYRGVPSGTIGLIIACHALGALTIGSWAPILLRTRDPTALMRSSLVAEICLALVCALCGGLEGAAFGSVFGICRFLLGGCVSINEVCNFAIAYRVVPTDKIPNVTAIVFFMRGFGTMAGPSIGGALYEVGGFALPLVAITPAFLLLYLMFVYACSYDPGMAPVPTTASVLGLLKIKPIWAALIGTPFLVYFLMCADGFGSKPALRAPLHIAIARRHCTPPMPGMFFGCGGGARSHDRSHDPKFGAGPLCPPPQGEPFDTTKPPREKMPHGGCCGNGRADTPWSPCIRKCCRRIPTTWTRAKSA